MNVGTGDLVLAGYPLGILYANGCITEAMHDAGHRLAVAHYALYGRKSAAAGRLELVSRGTGASDIDDEAFLVKCREQLRGVDRALSGYEDKVKQEVLGVAVYDQRPSWSLPRLPSEQGAIPATRLLVGLIKVAEAFGIPVSKTDWDKADFAKLASDNAESEGSPSTRAA